MSASVPNIYRVKYLDAYSTLSTSSNFCSSRLASLLLIVVLLELATFVGALPLMLSLFDQAGYYPLDRVSSCRNGITVVGTLTITFP